MRIASLIAVATVLVAAPAAQAKEITEVRACGVDACVTTHDPVILQTLMNGGPPTVPPSTQGGVISLRATVSAPDGVDAGQFTTWWLPSTRMLVAEDGTWMRAPARAEPALERVAGHLEPFPGAKIGLTDEPAKAAPEPAKAAREPADDGGGTSWLLIALPVAALAVAALVARRRFPHSPVKQGV
jgi:hypothetical protein